VGDILNTDIALADVDGDGDLDAFVANFRVSSIMPPDFGAANQVLENDGQGNFSDSGQSLGNLGSLAIAMGDLDNDGDLDAFVANASVGEDYVLHKVWLNDEGSFSSGECLVAGESGTQGFSFGVALGDVDGDGNLDAFVANVDTDRVYLNMWLQGQWYLADSNYLDKNKNFDNLPSMDVALGDLDGDDDLDAFVAKGDPSGETPVPNLVLINDGEGNFSDSGQSLGNSLSMGVALGDLDNDGDLDAFVVNTGANRIWLNNGQGSFNDSGQGLGNLGSMDVDLGDLDGDDDLDAFVTNMKALNDPASYGAPNAIWLNDDQGSFSDSGLSLGNSASKNVALGDLDGDDDLDAFVVNLNQPYEIWFNEGQEPPAPPCSEIIAQLQEELAVLQAQIASDNETIADLVGQLAAANQTIDSLNMQIASDNETITDLAGQLAAANQTIAGLNALIAALQNAYQDTMPPAGAVHADSSFLFPPNNRMVEVTLSGYVRDELSISRDGDGEDGEGPGVSNAYLFVNGEEINLLPALDGDGAFSVLMEFEAARGALYTIELYAADTTPGGPNSGLIDRTYVRVFSDMGNKGK